MLHGPGLMLMVVNSKALSIWFSSMCLGGFLFQAIQEADAFFLVDRVVTDKLLNSFSYPFFVTSYGVFVNCGCQQPWTNADISMLLCLNLYNSVMLSYDKSFVVLCLKFV